MEDILKKGNHITTNGLNGFLIIGVNEDDIAVQDMLTDDFEVMGKREHTYEIFNPRSVLIKSLVEILRDLNDNISTQSRNIIENEMCNRINAWVF